jgi:hypothetical protein
MAETSTTTEVTITPKVKITPEYNTTSFGFRAPLAAAETVGASVPSLAADG